MLFHKCYTLPIVATFFLSAGALKRTDVVTNGVTIGPGLVRLEGVALEAGLKDIENCKFIA